MPQEVKHPEGLVLRAMIEPRIRPVDIARRAGTSRQFVHAVLNGKERASPRVIAACRDLGLPVDVIWKAGKD
jgi:hypothetical protein